MTETVDIHALAGAYVLDAVDDIERAAFDRHLRDCATCAIEVAELKETATWLSYPVAITPPPGMREAVFARVANTPQERARRAAPSTSARRGRWQRWAVAAVAASVLGVGVGTGTWVVADQGARAQRQINAQMQAVVSAPDAQLVNKDLPGGGRISFVVSPSRDAGVAVLSGMPPAGVDKIYQLWMVRGSTTNAIPVGTLDGDGTKYIDGLQGANQFAVSREPAGGSATPTDIIGGVSFQP
jgi:anti-sigma-K factor RskA